MLSYYEKDTGTGVSQNGNVRLRQNDKVFCGGQHILHNIVFTCIHALSVQLRLPPKSKTQKRVKTKCLFTFHVTKGTQTCSRGWD